jgi:hypothetical protein
MSNDNDKETGALVERARDKTLSKQPRFAQDYRTGFYDSLVQFMKKWAAEELKLPDYLPNSMRRDAELQKLWYIEPHWAGVINQCILVDSSRGWYLVGGRNQTLQYSQIFHNADGGKGWRYFMRKSSLSYRVTDMGSVTELGREGKRGPLRALYHVDSARSRWTGNIDEPLAYYPVGDGVQYWPDDDFFSVVSMPSDNEKFRGLGFCQTSRAFEIIKILYGVMMHDQESIGSHMPRGLMLLNNIGDPQWEDALESREADRTAKEREYFGGVMILANVGTDAADVKLVALSQLPEHFDRETFINQAMAAYALVSGYDVSEFWPVSAGVIGRGKETEIQYKRAVTKGVLEYPHAFQEQLQEELPASLLFQFEERDAEGELLDAQVAQAWVDVAKTLSAADPATLQQLISTEQGLSYLVDKNVLPPEITEIEEEEQMTDMDETRLKRLRRRYIEYESMRRAAECFPDEPIVEYRWSPPNRGRMRVLWDSGYEAMRPRVWRVPMLESGKTRQQDDEDAVLYEDAEADVIITMADVERAIEQGGRRVGPEFEELLTAETVE